MSNAHGFPCESSPPSGGSQHFAHYDGFVATENNSDHIVRFPINDGNQSVFQEDLPYVPKIKIPVKNPSRESFASKATNDAKGDKEYVGGTTAVETRTAGSVGNRGDKRPLGCYEVGRRGIPGIAGGAYGRCLRSCAADTNSRQETAENPKKQAVLTLYVPARRALSVAVYLAAIVSGRD